MNCYEALPSSVDHGGKEGKKEERLAFKSVLDTFQTGFAFPTKTKPTGTHCQTGCVKQSSAHACNMSGGPPCQKLKNSGSRTTNINVNGGVQNTPILDNNVFEGPFACKLNYTGPALPAGVGAGSGQPQQEYAADGALNITNEGGLMNQPIMSSNRFADSVDIGGDINVQEPAAQNKPVQEEDDESMDLK
ncbi:hypothetical protein SRHO_G00164150 [Serrasalmus rhombeus]